MDGPIQTIIRERIIDRSGEILPMAWCQSECGSKGFTQGKTLTTKIPGLSQIGEKPVLLFLGNNSRLLESFPSILQASARVYVLCSKESEKEATALMAQESTNVLIRKIPYVPVSAIIQDKMAVVGFGSEFVLHLDDKQSEALRHIFIRMFWHDATEEAWQEKGKFQWNPAAERPFDVPVIPASGVIKLVSPDANLVSKAHGAIFYLNSMPLPKGNARRIWFPAGPAYQDSLAQLAQNGCDIVWDDKGLPDIAIDSDTGEILFSGTTKRLLLSINDSQRAEISKLLAEQASWTFQTNMPLERAEIRKFQFWLPNAAAKAPINPMQTITLPEIQASTLRKMEETEPDSLPPPSSLALKVKYQWSVIPPRLPHGCEDDPLVIAWRTLDKEWANRISAIEDALLQSSENQGRISKAFARLTAALLGFGRTQSDLWLSVEELEKITPSELGPENAQIRLHELAQLELRTKNLLSELDEAERKAREDEERDKQKAEWEKRTTEARQKASERKKELQDSEEQWKRISNDLDLAKEILSTAVDAEKKDIEAKRKKLSDDLNRVKKNMEGLRDSISEFEKQAAKPFEFRPIPEPSKAKSKPNTNRFIPTVGPKSIESIAPVEQLPRTGILHKKGKQRYLAISVWKDLDFAEQDANRLNAELVAMENK